MPSLSPWQVSTQMMALLSMTGTGTAEGATMCGASESE